MRLLPLQQRLQAIYEIDAGHDVEDFVFSDTELARTMEAPHTAREVPEKLLVREHRDGMDISLFLHPELLHKLKQDDPNDSLHHGNLADFCTVTEGVSHFVCLTWNARHARSVSLFELELQAEVDKYVMTAALLADQLGGSLPNNLPHVLFNRPTFHHQLNHGEQQRYRLANAYARHYCHNLHRSLLELGNSILITRELRRFYRLLQHKKLQRISTLPQHH